MDEEFIIEKSINTNTERINDLAIFPKGNIITVSSNLMIKIFDENGEQITFLSNAHEKKIHCICIINNNEFLTGSLDKKIKYFKILNNKIIESESLKGHENSVMKILYIEKNEQKKIISCGYDRLIKIWEKNINKNVKFTCTMTLYFHESPVYSCIYMENNIFVSCETNDYVFVWDSINYKISKKIPGTIFSNNALKKIDDENFIIGGGSDKRIKIINIKKGNIKFEAISKCWVYAILITENYIFDAGENPFLIEIRKKDLSFVKEINCINQKTIFSIVNFKNNLIISEEEFLSIYKKTNKTLK
jgi:WD40 repeat protein